MHLRFEDPDARHGDVGAEARDQTPSAPALA
jgi:hypothetical protein